MGKFVADLFQLLEHPLLGGFVSANVPPLARVQQFQLILESTSAGL
ncbi:MULTISPECIES: hypothetical protein [Pirellulaceae]|nr:MULTISPECIES: hypothetical protein [Pirellulaceae]